ncbi:MAG: Ig-like domain-containing protein [Gemmatimonadales bacterium]
MTGLRLLHLLPPAAAAVFWGCGGDDLTLPSSEGPRLQIVQGDEQQAPAGSSLADPLIVRLLDPAGKPVADRAVVWVVRAGDGMVDPPTGMTDAQGFASTAWSLGPEAGPNAVDAEVPNVGSVTFTAIATDTSGGEPTAMPSADRSTIGADPTSIAAGSGVSTITVTVLDGNGNPVQGATVALQATGDGNTLTQPSAATGADGKATGTLQSSVPGNKTVSALVNASVTLTQTVVVTVS